MLDCLQYNSFDLGKGIHKSSNKLQNRKYVTRNFILWPTFKKLYIWRNSLYTVGLVNYKRKVDTVNMVKYRNVKHFTHTCMYTLQFVHTKFNIY